MKIEVMQHVARSVVKCWCALAHLQQPDSRNVACNLSVKLLREYWEHSPIKSHISNAYMQLQWESNFQHRIE